MGESENEPNRILPRVRNTTVPARSRPRSRDTPYNATSTFPYIFIPKRPRVIKMRDLSPATKARLYQEYYEVYDPWTGIRIAATLGILISLFTLFLIYKSKYNKTRNSIVTSKKTSLYLYEEDLDCDIGNLGSSDDTGSFAYSFRYGVDDRLPGISDYRFSLRDNYPMEEVFVKSSVVECVALTVHKNQKGSKGPKYGTLRITEDASRSLPCSPYKQKRKTKTSESAQDSSSRPESTLAKQPYTPTPPPVPDRDVSSSGSITSFSSTDTGSSLAKTTVFAKPRSRSCDKPDVLYQSKKTRKAEVVIESGACEGDDTRGLPISANTVIVSSKRPQDYRSRSTVVTIGRRKRKS